MQPNLKLVRTGYQRRAIVSRRAGPPHSKTLERMSLRKHIVLAVVIGLALSILVLGVSFSLSATGIPQLFDFVLYTSLPTAAALSAALPNSLVYWAVPDGGPVAGVLLFLGAAVLQQTVVFGALAFFFIRMRSNRAPHRDGREAAPLGQSSSAPARGRER